MIILDTNVVSEMMRDESNANVVAWFDRHVGADLYLTAMTVAEIRYGIALLPHGRRRQTMARLFAVIRQRLNPQVLPFDAAAAEHYGQIRAGRAAAGRPLGSQDAVIASIAAAQQFAVATRNVKDFEGTGIEVIDPWAAAAT